LLSQLLQLVLRHERNDNTAEQGGNCHDRETSA
jgi:hypothetical protein